MIVVMVSGGGLGWIVRRARIQWEALASVKRAGGRAWYGHRRRNRGIPKGAAQGTAPPWIARLKYLAQPSATSGWPSWVITTHGSDSALKLVAAAEAEAGKHHWPVAVTIVHSAGFLVAFHRLDNTQLGSIEVSLEKVKTSAMFRRPSKYLEEAICPGRRWPTGIAHRGHARRRPIADHPGREVNRSHRSVGGKTVGRRPGCSSWAGRLGGRAEAVIRHRSGPALASNCYALRGDKLLPLGRPLCSGSDSRSKAVA
jgi:hypothetical protein